MIASNALRIGRRHAAAALLALPLLAAAHEGHDDAPAPAPVATGADTARFAVASDAFELVGALHGRRLTLWLDRFADNAPVTNATIELEAGGQTVVARAHGDVYEAELPAAPAPGRLPLAATITAPDASDLLAAELVIGAPAAAGRADTPSAADGRLVRLAAFDLRTAGLAAAGVALAALGWVAARRRRA